MDKDPTVTLICSFIGGVGVGFLRGFSWFGEAATYLLAIGGGALATWLISSPTDAKAWTLGIMANTLMVLGAVMAQGGAAKVRATTSLPAGVMPKFNELGSKDDK